MTSSAMTQPPPSTAEETAASLYAYDLHPEATEADLLEAFSRVVAVDSVHKSLSHAYVNFFSPDDASKALACLNHTELRGKPMRIMRRQADPSTREFGVGNLYVKNLDPFVTRADLEKLFSEFGTILSSKVVEENGTSKGFGYVQFDSEDSATRALDALHGTSLEGKPLFVSKFVKKSVRKGTSGLETFTNLYVKNLDDDLTEDILREKFSEHGNICSAVIMKDYQGKSKGFGFVQFGTHEEAMKAKEALNGAQIGSKVVYVDRAYRQENSELYVKNLDKSIDRTKLKEVFSAYGTVTSAEVITDDNGVSRGFGFVSFTSAEEAKKALVSLDGTTIQGSPLCVEWAQRREERSRHRHETYHAPNYNFLPYSSLAVPPRYNFIPCPPVTVPYVHLDLHRLPTAVYPFRVSNYWEYTSVPPRRPLQETARNLFSPCNAKPFISAHDQTSQAWEHQRSYRKGELNKIHCSRNEPFRGSSASEKPLVATSSLRRCKNIEKKFQPKFEKFQEPETKTTVMLLEMSKSDAQRLLSSPHSLGRQVEKAVQVLRAGNSQGC